VEVVMKEFRFVLSVRSVRVGSVTFPLVNRGHVAHDLKIAGRKSAVSRPESRACCASFFTRPGGTPICVRFPAMPTPA
jgi:hypothetical protein